VIEEWRQCLAPGGDVNVHQGLGARRRRAQHEVENREIEEVFKHIYLDDG
jgi:hypothetical protein